MVDYLGKQMSHITDSISLAQSNPATAKWMKISDSMGGLNTIAERGVQAGILNNFKKHVIDSVDAASTLGDQTNTMADFGPFVPEVLPIVTAWYPEFPLKDLISVQTLEQDLAYMLFSKLVTGTNKAPTIVGQVVETATGMRQINGYYPTGEIIGETIPSEQLEIVDTDMLVGATAYFALNTTGDYLSKFKLEVITTTAGVPAVTATFKALSVSGDKILLYNATTPGVDSGSYMLISNGGIYIDGVVTATTNISINASYVWNLDYAIDENIPTVKEQVDRIEMRAIPRVLSMKWTMFAEALKKSQFGKDIRKDNTKRVLDLLYQYQVRYVLDQMWNFSEGTPGTVSIPTSNTYSLDVQASVAQRQLKQYATQIELASGRMEGNRIVCGRDFKSWLESLPSNWYTPTPTPSGYSSPREIGTFGSFKVYFDPFAANNKAFMTYRGSEWYDAAMYMGIFLPFAPSDITVIGITGRMAFASMEAYKFYRPNCVVPLTISFA